MKVQKVQVDSIIKKEAADDPLTKVKFTKVSRKPLGVGGEEEGGFCKCLKRKKQQNNEGYKQMKDDVTTTLWSPIS